MPETFTPIETTILQRVYAEYQASEGRHAVLMQSPPGKGLEWEQAVLALIEQGYVVVTGHAPPTPNIDKLYVHLKMTEAGRTAWQRHRKI